MEKNGLISTILLGACLVVLVVNTVTANVIRIQLDPEPTLFEKVIDFLGVNRPKELKMLQTFSHPDFLEITLKDNAVTSEISAPNNYVTYNYDYWTGRKTPEYHIDKHAVSDPDIFRFVYVNAIVKNLYKKGASINSLAEAKIVSDGKYEFPCSIVYLNNKEDRFMVDTDTELPPLWTVNTYWVAEVPNSFAYSQKPMTFELTIDKQKYELKLK